jgi:hypothetical protein
MPTQMLSESKGFLLRSAQLGTLHGECSLDYATVGPRGHARVMERRNPFNQNQQ